MFETDNVIEFFPLVNGLMSTPNFAFSENSTVLKPYTISCASTSWISPAGSVPFVKRAITPNSATPKAVSVFSDFFNFL